MITIIIRSYGRAAYCSQKSPSELALGDRHQWDAQHLLLLMLFSFVVVVLIWFCYCYQLFFPQTATNGMLNTLIGTYCRCCLLLLLWLLLSLVSVFCYYLAHIIVVFFCYCGCCYKCFLLLPMVYSTPSLLLVSLWSSYNGLFTERQHVLFCCLFEKIIKWVAL